MQYKYRNEIPVYYLYMKETWHTIYKGYYAVSNMGRIKRMKCGSNNTYVGKILRPILNSKGYIQARLYISNGRVVTPLVHILVAKYFIGPCPKGKEVDHKNDNKGDPIVSNLHYITHRKNMLKCPFMNRDTRGERNGSAKLNNYAVKNIRSLYKIGKFTQSQLAEKFNVSISTISRVVTNKGWR